MYWVFVLAGGQQTKTRKCKPFGRVAPKLRSRQPTHRPRLRNGSGRPSRRGNKRCRRICPPAKPTVGTTYKIPFATHTPKGLDQVGHERNRHSFGSSVCSQAPRAWSQQAEALCLPSLPSSRQHIRPSTYEVYQVVVVVAVPFGLYSTDTASPRVAHGPRCASKVVDIYSCSPTPSATFVIPNDWPAECPAKSNPFVTLFVLFVSCRMHTRAAVCPRCFFLQVAAHHRRQIAYH